MNWIVLVTRSRCGLCGPPRHDPSHPVTKMTTKKLRTPPSSRLYATAALLVAFGAWPAIAQDNPSGDEEFVLVDLVPDSAEPEPQNDEAQTETRPSSETRDENTPEATRLTPGDGQSQSIPPRSDAGYTNEISLIWSSPWLWGSVPTGLLCTRSAMYSPVSKGISNSPS